MLSGRALAFVILAWSLVRVLARRLFTRPPPGLTLFRHNYGAEGLAPIERHERDVLERVSRCMGCGRCDYGEGQRMAASAGRYPGLMQLVLASSRSMPDFDAATRGFDVVPDEVLRDKVACCPVRLPFPDLAAFVRRKAPVAGAIDHRAAS